MNQSNVSEPAIDEQPIEKKAIWVSPDFTILSNNIINGSGDAGPDFLAQLGS
ncbi:hypothetical protein [Emticicia fontis]